MLFGGPDGSIDDPNADKGPLLVNVSAAMVALSCIAVVLRFLARRVSRTPVLADDFLLIAALPFTWATAANTIYGVVRNNLGTHLQLADIQNIRKLPACALRVHHSLHLKFYFAQAIPSIITDIILLVLPLPLVWKLKVTKSQKWGVSAVFMLGGFVTICSIIRLARLIQTQDNLDFTWGLSDPALWSTVEMHIFVCCACLPSTWCLVKLLLDHSPAHRRRSESVVTSTYGSPERLTLGSQFKRENDWPLSPFEEPAMPDSDSRIFFARKDLEWADAEGPRPPLPEKDNKWAKLGAPMPPLPAVQRFV
ncbi:hypothetical protein MMC32_005301 [Xylographa parallela]|nr:hypothetical protein [Xylographa parallela]